MSDKTKAIITTLVKTFIVAAVGQFLVFGKGIFDLTQGEWKGVLASGLTALLMFVYNWANPNDPRYGRGSE